MTLRLIQHNRQILSEGQRLAILDFDTCPDQFKHCPLQVLAGRAYRVGRDLDVSENWDNVIHSQN